MKNYVAVLFLSALATIACERRSGQDQAEETESGRVTLEEAWISDSVFKTPESVLYNSDDNILYVSNINGTPGEKDGNGFISKLSLDGDPVELEWVKGLNAPKGMGVSDTSLFVTDIDELVQISLSTGEIAGRFPVEGAGFLNDVTVDDGGVVYFSDSETGKIYRFSDGQVEVFLDSAVDGVNGLLYESGRLLALVNGDRTIREIDINSRSIDSLASFSGHGDGIVAANDSSYLISNWEGEIYYWTRGEEPTRLLDTKDENINAADIDYAMKENLLLTPTFFNNRVMAYRLATGSQENEAARDH